MVVWLSNEEATRSELTGAKTAALASASSDGLPVIPGFVIPVEIDPGLNTAAVERIRLNEFGEQLEALDRFGWAFVVQ